MSAENFPHLPQGWRLKTERLKLEGQTCSNCGTNIFPKKMFCPNCNFEIEARFLNLGTVKAILIPKGTDERSIELEVAKGVDKIGIKLGLNGNSHSAKLEIGLQIPIFTKKSTEGKEIYLADLTSLISK